MRTLLDEAESLYSAGDAEGAKQVCVYAGSRGGRGGGRGRRTAKEKGIRVVI